MDAKKLFDRFDGVPWPECYIQHELQPTVIPIFIGHDQINRIRISKHANDSLDGVENYYLTVIHVKTRPHAKWDKSVLETIYVAHLFKSGYPHIRQGRFVSQIGYGMDSTQPVKECPAETAEILERMLTYPGEYQIIRGTC